MSTDAVGGVWTFALELAGGLVARGVEVLLAVLGPAPDKAHCEQARAIPGLLWTHRPFPLEWMLEANENNQAAAGRWLLDIADAFAPDIVHLNHFGHGDLRWPAPVVVVAHSCVGTWYRAVRGTDTGPEWAAYRQWVARGLAGAALVVAPTHAMLHALRQMYGVVFPARVIHNGRTPEDFPAARKQPFVFAAGRVWDEAKNIAALDAAAPHVPWPVKVAGDPVHPEGGRAELANVELLGPQGSAAMAGLFARAAIYALPARYEPFGLTIVEAASAGCALVLGDIPSLRELWEDTAIFVPPDDTAALVEAINGLASRRRYVHDQGARARRHARRYATDRMVAGWRQAYAAMLREEGSACAS